MKMRKLILTLSLLASAFFTSVCHAAYSRYSNQVEANATLREVLVALDDVKHEVQNHETELRTFEEKARNLEEIIDSLRKQQSDSLQAMRESLKNLDAKISGQESAAKGLTTTLQSHASDSVAALSDYKKRIGELEKTLEQQNRNIENLQAAFKSLAEALQIKDSAKVAVSEDSGKIYRVKAGDSLDKIARQNQTTIKKIKELNGLTGDQIIVGQKLQLPE